MTVRDMGMEHSSKETMGPTEYYFAFACIQLIQCLEGFDVFLQTRIEINAIYIYNHPVIVLARTNHIASIRRFVYQHNYTTKVPWFDVPS